MEVLECGTDVKTKIGNVEGKITGITIRFNAVKYEVSYFKPDMEYVNIWVDEAEFEIINGSKKVIGFRNGI